MIKYSRVIKHWRISHDLVTVDTLLPDNSQISKCLSQLIKTPRSRVLKSHCWTYVNRTVLRLRKFKIQVPWRLFKVYAVSYTHLDVYKRQDVLFVVKTTPWLPVTFTFVILCLPLSRVVFSFVVGSIMWPVSVISAWLYTRKFRNQCFEIRYTCDTTCDHGELQVLTKVAS